MSDRCKEVGMAFFKAEPPEGYNGWWIWMNAWREGREQGRDEAMKWVSEECKRQTAHLLKVDALFKEAKQ